MKKEIGIVVISIALIISVASPYAVLLIGIPVFVIGLICLWISRTNRKTKLLWSVIPPILWFPLTAIWLFIYNSIGQMNAQKKDYYINEAFSGRLMIVESQCGNDPIVINDRLQFEIPENGVYFFNDELKSGHIDRRVFLKQTNGKTVQLEDGIWPTKSEEKDTLGNEEIIGFWGGSFGTRTDQNNDESNFITINIETNKVYTEKQIWKLHRTQDKLIEERLANCEK